MTTGVDHILSKASRWQLLILSVALTLLVGLADYLTGNELAFSLFFIAPIALAAWYLDRLHGLAIALLAACCWLAADLIGDHHYSVVWYPLWNSLVRLAMFSVIALLINLVRTRLLLEESLADTDALTGLANRRAFHERFEQEVARGRRFDEPFTLAFIDLDDFKRLNDGLGHEAGDEALVTVGSTLRRHTREIDVAARLGGDEFVVLFPRVGQVEALVILEKLHEELTAAKRPEWPISFSVGAITYGGAEGSIRDMLKAVDDLMYTVKRSGKGRLIHAFWPKPEQPGMP